MVEIQDQGEQLTVASVDHVSRVSSGVPVTVMGAEKVISIGIIVPTPYVPLEVEEETEVMEVIVGRVLTRHVRVGAS